MILFNDSDLPITCVVVIDPFIQAAMFRISLQCLRGSGFLSDTTLTVLYCLSVFHHSAMYLFKPQSRAEKKAGYCVEQFFILGAPSWPLPLQQPWAHANHRSI